jgi:DNA ligase 1
MTKNTEFQPMLAAKTPAEGFAYRFPLLVSPKLDGIRAIIRGGVVLSRSLKPIPNRHVQFLFGRPSLEGLDGELIVGAPTGRDANGDDVMQRTTKGVMRIEGEPEVTFHVFDHSMRPELGFMDRLEAARLQAIHDKWRPSPEEALAAETSVAVVGHVEASNQDHLDNLEAVFLESGFEGAMVRDPNGLYKFGRSTAKEGGLIKVKRFEDAEAVVVGFEERMHNDNEKTVDNLGHTKRSTHQENKHPAGDLGALVCAIGTGTLSNPQVVFNIGTGFTQGQRTRLWQERESLVGRIVKYKSFTAAGVKDAPRFPVFLGWRHPDDL